MKTLLTWNVVNSALPRFRYAQQIQNRLFPEAANYDRLIVSDQPLELADFATVVSDFAPAPDQICVGKARNAALAYALEHNYDVVVLLDLDAVLLEHVQPLPEDGFTLTMTYFSEADEIEAGDFFMLPKRWRGGGWFIVPRKFMHLRFCEEFVGYGSEDVDFHHNVLVPAGAQQIPWNTKALHIWHPPRNNNPNAMQTSLLLAKRLAKTFGRDYQERMAKWNDPGLTAMVAVYVHDKSVNQQAA